MSVAIPAQAINYASGTSPPPPPPVTFYLVQEDGISLFTLEDGSGALLLE